MPGGGPYVLIGRTKDYAWSLTTASNDNRDQFLEQLCEPDGSTPTRASPALRLQGPVPGDDHLRRRHARRRAARFPMTVHGPVFGTATVGGKPYAITRQRSTYGEDALSLAALHDMTTRPRPHRQRLLRTRPTSSGSRSTGRYASRRHDRLLLLRASSRAARPGVNKLLPTLGTGNYDWRGFISLREHPHDVGGPAASS